MATADELQASIAAIDAQLNSGLKLIQRGEKKMETDFATLRIQRAALLDQLAKLMPRATVRRVYITGYRGY